MRKTGIYGLLSLAALMMAGCQADVMDGRQGEVPITLTATVSEGNGPMVTRAGADIQSTQLPADATFLAEFTGSDVTVSSATYASDGSGGATPDPQPYFTLAGSSTTVHAYHGKSGGTTQVTGSTTSFSVASDQSTAAAYQASDLMYATASVTKASPVGALTFAHRMAKIIVNVTLGDGINSISAVKIVGGLPTVALSGADCTVGAASGAAFSSDNPLIVFSGSHSAGTTLSCAALIPPQTISGSFLLITTDRGTVTCTMPSARTFSGNGVYVQNITLTIQDITLSNITITAWGDQGSIDMANNGNATGSEVGPKPVDLGLSVKWADMNVGATSITDLGMYFMWGDINGQYYEESYPEVVFGWTKYRWGTQTEITKYYSTKNTESYIHWSGDGDPDNKIVLDPEDDPATVYLGTNWRMPTVDELQELLDTKSNTTDYSWVWQENYEESGQAGYLITVIKEGPLNGNSIFLIAAGAVANDYGMTPGFWGRIPSSSLVEEGPDAHYFLDIDENYASIWGNWRCYGYPVRAVRGN